MSSPVSSLYEFGPYRLDLEQRRFSRAGQVLPLPPKTLDLLALLVQKPGHAFSKQELMSALWPDTFVEDANLSFQISTLRKALGDGARWIETVPKHGYRFSGEVRTIPLALEPPNEPAPPIASPAVPAQLTRRDWRWIALTAIAIAVLIAGYAMVSRRTDGLSSLPGTHSRAVPLTSYEGTEYGPSLSPDGSQVAFSWTGPRQDNEDIYVKLVGPGEPLQLTTNPARDSSPAWSPDGRSIAFLRWSRQNDSDVDIMLVPALGNAAERRVASVTNKHPISRPLSKLAWTADSQWLAIAAAMSPEEQQGLWLLSLDGQQRRRLPETPERQGGAIVFNPAFSSDGRRLAYIRLTSANVASIYVLAFSADMMPEGAPVSVTDASQGSDIVALAWTENDSALVFSMSNQSAQSRLHRLKLTPDRLHGAGAAQALPFGDLAINLTASRAGRLVYSTYSRDGALWRLDLTQRGAVPQAPSIRGSTFDEHTPSYSRDGKRIVFTSTRTGTEELWQSNVDGTDLKQLTFMSGPLCSNPQWSPASDDLILFNSRLHGSSDLFLLERSTGRYEPLTTDPADEIEARWSRDGKSIYFGSNRTGVYELWKMPATGGGPATQITHHGGLAGAEADDGYIYYAKTPRSPTSIWRIPLAGGEEALVTDGLSYSLNFAVGRTGLYLMSRAGLVSDTAIEYFDFASRKRTRLAAVGKRWWFGMALSPDEKSLLYSVVESVNSNLMLVEQAW